MSSSLPDTSTFDKASLTELFSVVIHASRRCGLTLFQSVLVFGVGAIGLLACALAKHTGASRVCAIDINPVRLAFAERHGFADAVNCLPSPSSSSSDSFSSPLSSSPKANSVSTNGNGKVEEIHSHPMSCEVTLCDEGLSRRTCQDHPEMFCYRIDYVLPRRPLEPSSFFN